MRCDRDDGCQGDLRSFGKISLGSLGLTVEFIPILATLYFY